MWAPTGGSSPIGCLGYAVCAGEIVDQSRAADISFARVIVANGSSGTHAGLAAGFAAMGDEPRIVKSFAVLQDADGARRKTHETANATIALLNGDRPIPIDEIDVDGTERGPGYGIPTPGMVEAVRLVATHEGLLLDPVYSGKAFAGMLADM